MPTRRTIAHISVMPNATKAPNGGVWEHGTGKEWICWTPNNVDYFSYNTCIATRDSKSNAVVFNKTRYSTTTVRYQDMLIEMFTNGGNEIVYVDGLGFNVTPDDLLMVHYGVREASHTGTKLRKPTRYTGGGYALTERNRSTLI